MAYTLSAISKIIRSTAPAEAEWSPQYLLTDSRKLVFPADTLFFALTGPRRNGHQFIGELYQKGVRAFVVSDPVAAEEFPEAVLLPVPDTLHALQLLVAHHRKQYALPVIGITGSNGKTIVKEWLFQLLEDRYRIIRSPRSYNSQIGVPLSVWPLNETHELGIFEAGISQSGEMDKLKKIIQPTIGIFTNIGEAHSEGFLNNRQKINEKLRLFTDVDTLIYCKDDAQVHEAVAGFWQQLSRSDRNIRLLNWGSVSDASLQILTLFKDNGKTEISATWQQQVIGITIPFTDDASIENAIHCWCVLLHLGTAPEQIRKKMLQLEPVSMRLELKPGINQCTVINDSYSNDINSLRIALDFMTQQSTQKQKTVILSDILESGKPEKELYQEVAQYLQQHGVKRLIGIGDRIHLHQSAFQSRIPELQFYPDTSHFLHQIHQLSFRDEAILLKGARRFAFEDIDRYFELQQHQTVLEINLTALAHNLNTYQQRLKPGTRLMAMVKAFAYGSGSFEIARVLQFHRVDYLAVAYTDEAVELRKAGIRLPMMIMNPDRGDYEKMTEHNLEPVLYSLQSVKQFEQFLHREGLSEYPVHLELETGMNRLGIAANDMVALEALLETGVLKIQSLFTHLVASEDPAMDAFTATQAALFEQLSNRITNRLGYKVLRHIANTTGISRHSSLQLDMVRLGIGLYGIDRFTPGLRNVSTLRTAIAQLRSLNKRETVGYNRKGVLTRDSLIATIRIGYADGYPRSLSQGKGYVLIRGKQAPVVGTVCMDMTMVDVTDIPGVAEGDEVVVFGEALPVPELAQAAETIPYEIVAGISQRVKRVYVEE